MIYLKSSISFSEAHLESKVLNEDAVLPITETSKGRYLLAVADGVGSYNGASEISNYVTSFLAHNRNTSHEFFKNIFLDFLKKSIAEESIFEGVNSKAATTLAVCFLDQDGLSVWHIGDCRVYLRSENKLIQITTDHTQYQKLIDKKLYTKRELDSLNVGKNQLTTAISKWIDMMPDTQFYSIENLKKEYGDTLDVYIMSDGLHHFWDMRKRFSPNTMQDVIKFGNAIKRRVERHGSIDDYSLVSASFDISKSGTI